MQIPDINDTLELRPTKEAASPRLARRHLHCTPFVTGELVDVELF
jgi:hypothetical protein